ncbi:MAG: hypothetical protein ACR2J8_13190, partial [Thermomicrobiales bacterium]
IDLERECWGYRHTPPMLKALSRDPGAVLDMIPERSKLAFHAYQSNIQQFDAQSADRNPGETA